jgi:hypothetical protein
MTQTLPKLDTTSRASTASLAASANHAAAISQQLATVAASAKPNAAQVNSLVGQLKTALATTQAQAGIVNQARFTIQFCTFTIQIGPFIIDVPRIGLHIVIGPFFITFRAPCFLSGILPTHVP